MSPELIVLMCAGAAFAVGFILVLVAGLCKAAAATDEYMERIHNEADPEHPVSYFG